MHKVTDIKEIVVQGPWSTKSGAELNVLFALPEEITKRFFDYEPELVFDEIPPKIRGLRFYTVRNIPCASIGGGEFHKVCQEIIFVLEGKVLWKCEDRDGQHKQYVLTIDKGIWMPSKILHTYETLEPSSLLVVANTLYLVDDSETHDTYSPEEFKRIQDFRKWRDSFLEDFRIKLKEKKGN